MTSSIIFSILKNRFKKETFVLILRLLTLSAGLFCFLFVFNWLKSQYQLDGYNSKSEKLYRVIAYKAQDVNNDRFDLISTSNPLYSNYFRENKQVYNSFRFATFDTLRPEVHEKYNPKANLWFADEQLFKTIEYEFLLGNKSNPFENENSIVITDKYAKEIFGSIECLDSVLILDGYRFRVSAIVKDMPKFYHFQFEKLANIKLIENYYKDKLSNIYNFTYLSIPSSLDFRDVSHSLNVDLRKKAELINDPNKLTFSVTWLVPLWVNHSYNANISRDSKDESLFKIISSFASLIIFLAFLNYFIISQSDFSSRNKQFGLIKLFSNSIIEIVKTIFLENFIFSFFALILAYISLFIAKSILGSLYQFELFDTESILLVILILLILNIISTFLISFKIYKRPLAEILKANKSAGVASGFYRQTVLCFQLIVSLAFIIFSIGNNAKYENTRNQKLSYRNTEQFYYEKKNLDQKDFRQFLENFHKNSKIISSQLVNKNQLIKSLKSENYNLKSLNLDKFASNSEFLLIKVHTEKIASTLSFLKSELDSYPIFANPKLEKYLMNEQKISDILFVIICIFLFNSFLSLISTLKFIIDKRRKEIVIRKIYGAKIFDIQKLIFSELNVIIFVAIILSWMCAFFPLNSKLDSFSGNVGLRFEYFYMPSIAVFIVANFTILIQTFVYIRKLPLKLIKS